MKRIITALSLLLLVSACKKEVLEPQEQIITYKVQCKSCLVYIEDNSVNRTNQSDEEEYKKFNIDGSWEYSFINNGLNTVSLHVYISVFDKGQQVKSSIVTNDKKSISFNEFLGASFDNPYDYSLGKKIELKLN